MAYRSRFDTKHLLTGFAGDLVSKYLALPLTSCDLREVDNDTPWLLGTKVVLLMGEQALTKYNRLDPSLHLNQLRGNPWEQDGVIFISTYLPQDALDASAQYEQDHNPYYTYTPEDKDKGDEKSTKGRTARSNFRFWVINDCKRTSILLKNPNLSALAKADPEYKIFPTIEEILKVIYRDTNTLVYLDIETDMGNAMTVLSLAFNNENTVYTIPFVRYHGGYAYNELELGKIIRGLVWLFNRCTIVTHNGSGFDLPFLAMNYKVPPPRSNYDTMLVHARLYPGVEKSLGHCGSLYTWEPYHKNEGIFNPHNLEQEHQLWKYNAKDVWLMKLVREAQLMEVRLKRADSSVEQVNASIYPYLVMSLQGIHYSSELIDKRLEANERRLVQLARVLKVLVGHDLLPTSNKSCVKYFHSEMGFKAVRKTDTGNPSLDEKSLYKLAVANNCPTIPVCLEYRRIAKESGMLKFSPFKV